MKNLPIFRVIHQEEADHHARLVCAKLGHKEGSKAWENAYERAFYGYIQDAMGSLYPSGELATQNPIRKSSKKRSVKAADLKMILPEKDFDRLIRSRESDKLYKLLMLHEKWHGWRQRHLNRIARNKKDGGNRTEEITETESLRMSQIESKLLSMLKKDPKVTAPKRVLNNVLELSKKEMTKKIDQELVKLAKKMFPNKL